MHGRRIDSFLITDNLKLEIIHESNPYYAGEPVSLIVRIRHLGSQDELLSLKEGIKKLHQQNEPDEVDSLREEQKPTWSMRSLLDAFKGGPQDEGGLSQAERESNVRLQELISKQLQFHKPTDLMSGYMQMSGVFQFDPELVSEGKMKDAGSKMVGVNELWSQESVEGGVSASDWGGANGIDSSLAKYYNSKHIPSAVGLASMSEDRAGLNGEGNTVFTLGNMATGVEYGSVPIFLIPQTLLFSEINLEPGNVKSYRFRSANLPRNLAPTYNISKTLSITYSLEFGVSRLVHGEIKQHIIRVPITLAPYISSSGCQFTSTLDHAPLIMEPAEVKEIKQKVQSQKRPSATSLGHLSRRSSTFRGIHDKNDNADNVIRNFVNLVESNQDSFGNIEGLVDLQMERQFDEGKDTTDEISDNSQDHSEETLHRYTTKRVELVQDNISSLIALYSKSTETVPALKHKSNEIPQLTNLQKTYQINWNGQPITKVFLSKSFYTTADDIDLVLELSSNSPSMHRVSAVTVSLEGFELINRDYATDSKDMPMPHGNQVHESHRICFDTCERVPLKLLIPKTPMHQIPSQFRTDVFQFKWMLTFRFVLIPRSDTYLEQFYEDAKGTLLHAKDSLEGEGFSCHISVPILPAAHTFGGW